ncbi:S8 family serine peptidase [Kitasatospora sp. NBC_00070]|uniref:S8 family serine peptidase n=1 Tax=Kitasatospora sp. NBC_00070 TaxID=2975962 RepID=UPI0032446F55
MGGASTGVARQAKLVSVRITGCDNVAPVANVIAGPDWVAKNAAKPAVADISISSDKSEALNAAAEAVSNAGVLLVVDAGPGVIGSADTCKHSPAGAQRVITVAASTSNDTPAPNETTRTGNCISLFAPGQDVLTANRGGGTATESSAAMSSGFVAGVLALNLETNPAATPEDLNGWLSDNATQLALTEVPEDGTPNTLLYTSGL